MRHLSSVYAGDDGRLESTIGEQPQGAACRTSDRALAREEAAQDLDVRYKASIVCGIDQDEPGNLLLILSEFAYRHVNLTKVESRPSKRALGHYIFFIDMEGRRTDAAIAQSLKCLACKLPWLQVLGSYPA
jgi:prephenate dehydratase